MSSGIYLIQNTRTRLVYVGQSRNLRARFAWHKARLRSGGESRKFRTNRRLHASFDIHGEAAFQFVVLEHCGLEELTARETYWLNEFRSVHGFPVANFAGPASSPWAGCHHDDGSRQKISNALKGKNRSDSHRRRLSLAMTGKEASEETRQKMRAAHLGKPSTLNAEQIQLLTAQLGETIHSDAARAKMRSVVCKRVADMATGQIWTSVGECAEYLRVSVSAISNHISGKSKSCAGRVLRYL